jgi:hypothetical protein
MPFNLSRLVLVSILAGAGCAGAAGPGAGGSSGGAGGSDEGAGGSPAGGSGGRGGAGGKATGGAGGLATGGVGGAATGGAAGMPMGGAPGEDAGAGGSPGTEADASATTADGGGTLADGPGKAPDAGMINLEGPIPPYEGPPVGPEVKMDCPGDPTAGFTEYKDAFRVEHPYDLPTSARFSIVDGVYNFWVMQGDKRHNPNSTARNPRTEARWSQNFRTGVRMFSADIFWEKSVTNGTVVMQVHTTTTGIGPVYMVANGANVSPITASKVPGGLIDRWINLKVLIDAQSTASQYWVNNCLVASRGSGTRGDGNNYFKLGVYHCDAGTCRARAKNIHLYMKP